MSETIPTTIAIKDIIPEAEGIKTFVFENKLKFKPGQFVMLWIPGVDEKPFGTWNVEPGTWNITVSAVGTFSQKLHELKVGDKVGIRGPFGKGFSIPKGKKIVLVGGGFGTAPLLGLAAAAAKDCELNFIIGARSSNLLFGKAHAEKLGANVQIATDDGSAGEKGFATDLLEKILKAEGPAPAKAEGPAPAKAGVYSCGPELMLRKVAEICVEKNIPCELSLERFMKCGIGVCGSCVMDDVGFCVCKDGPVIAGEKALKLTEFGKYRRDSVGERQEL
ncbi:MAG: dihydroorotate dehydrogenase electron transfer subunit [Patescibacteria group bacterium]